MPKNVPQEVDLKSQLALPWVGSSLTVASGLAFLVVCMIIPLVGKAGAATDHYLKNWVTFFVALVITLLLSGVAIYSKRLRAKLDASPAPVFSLLIFGATSVLMVALLLGLLKI